MKTGAIPLFNDNYNPKLSKGILRGWNLFLFFSFFFLWLFNKVILLKMDTFRAFLH